MFLFVVKCWTRGQVEIVVPCVEVGWWPWVAVFIAGLVRLLGEDVLAGGSTGGYW